MLSKKKAIQYVISHPKGEVAELEKHIGAERLREFEYLGYIKNGISDERETYGATNAIQQDYKTIYKRSSTLLFLPSILFGGMAKLFS